MQNKNICYIGDSVTNVYYLQEQGYDVAVFPDFAKAEKHLINERNIFNYPITIVQEGWNEHLAKPLCDKADSLALPGQFGCIGSISETLKSGTWSCMCLSPVDIYAYRHLKAGNMQKQLDGSLIEKCLEACMANYEMMRKDSHSQKVMDEPKQPNAPEAPHVDRSAFISDAKQSERNRIASEKLKIAELTIKRYAGEVLSPGELLRLSEAISKIRTISEKMARQGFTHVTQGLDSDGNINPDAIGKIFTNGVDLTDRLKNQLGDLLKLPIPTRQQIR